LSATPTIAVLGLGEAGSAIAADLAAAGVPVRAFDPAGPAAPAGVSVAASAAEAAASADVVLSVNAASVALDVARETAPALEAAAGERPLFADLNTAAPALKRALAEQVGAHAVEFADVALLGPVPGRGLRTPALVSGTGAERFAAVFAPLGMPVTPVGPEAGVAAARKLTRSVFAKGLAAAVGEALAAAERLDCDDWLYSDIEATLTAADARLLRRLVEGSRTHAGRRAEEMAAAVAMLDELDVEPRVAAASEAWLRSLAAGEVAR
jgi:3-hydroxyisobutyrate dehydrogenase-like beta-hydroxyacid dehydrogenase